MDFDPRLTDAIEKNIGWVRYKCLMTEWDSVEREELINEVCAEDDQKDFSEMIMKHIRSEMQKDQPKVDFENVIQLKRSKIS